MTVNQNMQALQNHSFRARKGQEQSMSKLAWEIVGIVGFLIVLGLLVAWFFNAVLGDCDAQCQQAHEALQDLVSDIEEVCRQGDVGRMDGGEDLGQYNFGEGATFLAMGKNGEFTVGRVAIEDEGLTPKPIPDPRVVTNIIQNDGWSWSHTATVDSDNCQSFLQCEGNENVRECGGLLGNWDNRIRQISNTQYWSLWAPMVGSEGTMRYYLPGGEDAIHLKWQGGEEGSDGENGGSTGDETSDGS